LTDIAQLKKSGIEEEAKECSIKETQVLIATRDILDQGASNYSREDKNVLAKIMAKELVTKREKSVEREKEVKKDELEETDQMLQKLFIKSKDEQDKVKESLKADRAKEKWDT